MRDPVLGSALVSSTGSLRRILVHQEGAVSQLAIIMNPSVHYLHRLSLEGRGGLEPIPAGVG